jgi:hypothetical protein
MMVMFIFRNSLGVLVVVVPKSEKLKCFILLDGDDSEVSI